MIPKQNLPYLQDAVDGDVQAAYTNFFNKHMVSVACKLNIITGVKPRMDERMKEMIQEIYRFSFAYSSCIIVDPEKLKELTGVSPSEELLKKYPQFAEAFK